MTNAANGPLHEAESAFGKDFGSPTLVLLFTVSRLGRVVESFVRQATAAFDVDGSEASVLSALSYAPDHTLSPTQLREALVQTSPGMTATLDRLAQKQLITRESDPDDGRRRLVRLSASGADVASRLVDDLATTFDSMFSDHADDDYAQLIEPLRVVLDQLEIASGHRDSSSLRLRTEEGP